jgi:RimJ/RimL family protein N-acetyltransferase
MKVVADDRVARFVESVTETNIIPPYTTLGIERDGQIVGGAVFNHFTGPDIHVSIAGHGWTKGFIADVGAYVFDQLGCLRITAITEQASVVKFAQRLGGEVEGLMRDHFGRGRDAFVVGILRADWRF